MTPTVFLSLNVFRFVCLFVDCILRGIYFIYCATRNAFKFS